MKTLARPTYKSGNWCPAGWICTWCPHLEGRSGLACPSSSLISVPGLNCHEDGPAASLVQTILSTPQSCWVTIQLPGVFAVWWKNVKLPGDCELSTHLIKLWIVGMKEEHSREKKCKSMSLEGGCDFKCFNNEVMWFWYFLQDFSR